MFENSISLQYKLDTLNYIDSNENLLEEQCPLLIFPLMEQEPLLLQIQLQV